MTRERAKALVLFIKAYSEGREIEYSFDREEWKSSRGINEFIFEHPDMDIRFPVAQEYRPFEGRAELVAIWATKTGRSAIKNTMPLIWVKHKQTGKVYCISGFHEVEVIINGEKCDMKSLFDNFTFLDGLPCGIKR